MTIDTEHFRAELLEHRERLLGTIKHHEIGNSSLIEETGELMSSSADNHLADTASETYERELDEGLEDDAREQLRQVDEALAGSRPARTASARPAARKSPSSGSKRCRGRRSASKTHGSCRVDRARET